MYVWKKAQLKNPNNPWAKGRKILVRLRLTGQTRINFDTKGKNKHRCDRAEVVSIHRLNGKRMPTKKVAYGLYHPYFAYTVGTIVTPERDYALNQNTCASGIHFFLTRAEARAWAY